MIACNACCDCVLIFGLLPGIPALGAKGASIARGISMAIQVAVLSWSFLKKENRVCFGTGKWLPNFGAILKTIKVTGPPAVLYNIELWGWSLFYTMMAATSDTHITVSSLCESLIFIFIFIAEGFFRGTLLMANNSIAQGRPRQLRRIFASGCIILGSCLAVQLALLTISPYIYVGAVSPITDEIIALMPTFETCIRFVLLYLFFQGIQWVLSAILCAMGATMSMTIAGTMSLFAGLVFPAYFFVLKRGYPAEWAWGIVLFYTITCCAFYGTVIYARLKKGAVPSWQSLSLGNLQSPLQVIDKVG